ncbi:hypothetical protein As57867_017642, partial [Aphanomyces stellatus]
LVINTQVSVADIKAAAQRVGVSPAEFNKIAWAVTLRKYTRQDDVVFGQVMANRDMPVKDADSILGPLINTVPYRVKFDEAGSLQAIFDAVQHERGGLLAHSFAGLVDVKQWSGVDGELFDTLFVFWIADLWSNASPFSTEYSLELILVPTETGVRVQGLFKPSVLSRSQAKWMLAEFDFAMTQLCDMAGRECDLSTLMDLSPAQTQFIETASFGSQTPLPYELLHHAFEERAMCHPEAPAIEFEGVGLSYGDVNNLANAVAKNLINRGVVAGSRVAVIMDRCLELPVAMLAILKAGATVVCLNASFPPRRLELIVGDANCQLVVTSTGPDATKMQLVWPVEVYCLSISDPSLQANVFNSNIESQATTCHEAYVVYTSGSTGKPKGVPVLHSSVVNTIVHTGVELGFGAGVRAMQCMAISFDGYQADMWRALTFGATMVMRGGDFDEVILTVDLIT